MQYCIFEPELQLEVSGLYNETVPQKLKKLNPAQELF